MNCYLAWSLEINGPEAEIDSIRPHLPASLGKQRILYREIAGAIVDLLLVRHEQEVGVNMRRRDGDVQLLVRQ
jgi:hypothetical protein